MVKKGLISIASVLLLTAAPALASTDVQFVLDVSGSMAKEDAGTKQIDAAKKALINALKSVPEGARIALRAYGHRVEQADKHRSCQDTELLVPFMPIDGAKTSVANKLAFLTPRGYTPIAYSLKQVANDFDIKREADRVVILLSDGKETCGGDPIAVLEELKAMGIDPIVHTIGFNVDDETRRQLQSISSFTKGRYFDVRGASQLQGALEEATKASLKVIKKKSSAFGDVLRGGDSYETAAKLPVNKPFRLDHDQKPGEFDYFYIDSEGANWIEVAVKTLEKGLEIWKGNIKKTDRPSAGIILQDNDGKKILERIIAHEPNTRKAGKFPHLESQRFYILVGASSGLNDSQIISKESAVYSVNIKSIGDGNTKYDAGAGSDSAVAITPGRYTGAMGRYYSYQDDSLEVVDLAETYSFEAKAGEMYIAGIIPQTLEHKKIGIRVYDEYKEIITSKWTDVPNSGLKTNKFLITTPGKYLVHIFIGTERGKNYGGYAENYGTYTIDLRKISDAAPAQVRSLENEE